ncbi:MAG: response regulator [Holophagaceae bacterium]|nr:response regulator [Holophagaceae bacterium]
MAQKILLVEDDPINVKFIEVVLTRMGGYEVIVSEDVEEILALAKGGTLAGIIMDISLARSSYQGKKVDGIFITKLIKADPESAKIPVLMATAHAMYGDREKFLAETGAEGYLSNHRHDPNAFLPEVQSVVKKP